MSSHRDDDAGGQVRKKVYVKPEVQQVALRPEEAVLASCKTSKTSGAGQSKCSIPSACSSLAS